MERERPGARALLAEHELGIHRSDGGNVDGIGSLDELGALSSSRIANDRSPRTPQ
jgi:hypothetical protein